MRQLSALFPFSLLLGCATPASESKYDPAETGRKMIGLEEKFDRFDLDGNGLLTRKELTDGMRSVDMTDVTPAEVGKAIDFYDRNGDGRISLREAQRGSAAGAEALIERLE